MPSPGYRDRVHQALSDVAREKGDSISMNDLLARVRLDCGRDGIVLGPRAATYINKVVTELARTGRITRSGKEKGGLLNCTINLTARGTQFFKRLNSIQIHPTNDSTLRKMSIRQNEVLKLDELTAEIQDVLLEFQPNAQLPLSPELIASAIETACSQYDTFQKLHGDLITANANDRAAERRLLSYLRKTEEGLGMIAGSSSSTQ
ncbi:hypothetical protein ACG7TL_006645 [Trametes sanguinea]